MWTLRAGDRQAVEAGIMQSCQLDLSSTARYGKPGIVPSPNYTGLGVFGPTDPRFSYTGTWASGATVTPESTVSVAYSGVGLEVVFQTGPQGGIGFVTLDGGYRLAVDTYAAAVGQTTYAVLSPAPGGHLLQVTYHGDIDGAAVPFTTPANGTGTTVAPNLSLARTYRSQTTSASHTITALSSTTVSVDGSGSYAAGSTISGVVPGVMIAVGTAAMTTGDTATFQTYATGLTVVSGQVSTVEMSGASYTTGLVDCRGKVYPISSSFTGGATSPLFFTLESSASIESDTASKVGVPFPMMDPDVATEPVQWVLAYWDEHPQFPVQTGMAKVGSTNTPSDPTWMQTGASSTPGAGTLLITHDVLQNGDAHGYMGLAAMPRADFCVLRIDIPQGGYIRNLRFACWVPETDGERDRFPEYPGDDLTLRYLAGHVAAICMDLRDPFREASRSLSYGTAVGKYLDARLAEWGIVRPYGMADETGASLLRLLSVAHAEGATLDFVNNALALMLGPGVPFQARTLKTTTTQWVLGTSLLGVDTYLSPVTVGQFQALISIATNALTIPPQAVQQLMNIFLTVGVNLTIVWS